MKASQGSMVITDIQQVTPAWLTERLRESGCLPQGTVSEIEELESARTNVSAVYHLAVRYADGDAPGAPRRLFLKMPQPDFTWGDKEVKFYRSIAPAMLAAYSSSESPFLRCYDAAYSAESLRSHLLLEDASETHFSVDGPMPPTTPLCEQVIDAFARLHAYWWEHPRLGCDVGELLTAQTIEAYLAKARHKQREFSEFMGERLTQKGHELLASVAHAWPARRRERLIRGQGVTLVHRDPHPLNFLYPNDLRQANVKLIDWQSWRVDTGTDDLAYMMAMHWPPENRAEIEQTLLQRYHERLVALGVQGYSQEDLLYDYRASIVRCLFFLLVAWSSAQWERGVWWGRMQRGMLAFDDWECAELL